MGVTWTPRLAHQSDIVNVFHYLLFLCNEEIYVFSMIVKITDTYKSLKFRIVSIDCYKTFHNFTIINEVVMILILHIFKKVANKHLNHLIYHFDFIFHQKEIHA